MAEKVLRMPELGAAGGPPAIQRMCAECEEEQIQRQLPEDEEEQTPLQAKGEGAPAPAVSPRAEARISALRGGGRPLPAPVRGYFEPRLGRDLGAVRVHTGSEAATAAHEIRARAFTVGSAIAFGAGEWRPETTEGQRLLAHELVHTAQQDGHRIEGCRPPGEIRRSPEPDGDADPDLTGPLSDREWERVRLWRYSGRVGVESLTDDPDHNALVVAAAIFCSRGLGRFVSRSSNEDPLLCVIPEVTRADPRVRRLRRQVVARGPITSLRALAGPLTDREWELVTLWQSRGEVAGEPLTADPDHNALVIADAIFCSRALGMLVSRDSNEDPLLCVIPEVTRADPRVRYLASEVAARGPIIEWARVDSGRRMLYVMERLVDSYGFPETGAAGVVGNLWSESGVLPHRIQGSAIATPMRAPSLRGGTTDFTAEEVMNRSEAARRGPRALGIGLAQWTTPGRRAGLFQHTYQGRQLGAAILFNMDAQVDYLVSELQTLFPGVYALVTRPGVSVDAASDEVVYRFETPRPLLFPNRSLRPRNDPAVQAVFRARRTGAHRALRAYREAHPE